MTAHEAELRAVCRNRPFTDRLMKLRDQGARMIDLERRSLEARSTTWFNKLLRSDDPWVVSPPTACALHGLAVLFGTSVTNVEAMVATEWYGIEGIRASTEVRAVASQLGALTPADLALVEMLVSRLLQVQSAHPRMSG